MFKRTGIIQQADIEHFYATKEALLFFNSLGFEVIDNKFGELIKNLSKKDESPVLFTKKVQEYLIVVLNTGVGYIVDDNGGYKQFDDAVLPKIYKEKWLACYEYDYDLLALQSNFLSLFEERKHLFSDNILGEFSIVDNLLFLIYKETITRVSENSHSLWSLSVADLGRHYFKSEKRWEKGEVDKFLGIYKMVLWVLLKNGLIIGLDIETGKIVHEIKEPVEYPLAYTLLDKELNNFYGKPSMLDSVKGKIIGIAQSGIAGSFPSYYEIDLDIPIVQLKIMQRPNDDFQGFHADGGAIGYAWPFDNDYIYLCNYRDYKLALFNRMAKQIDWVHQMEVDPAKKTFIIKMEVHGNRWYVLDNSKTLYVYEREA